MSYQITHEQLEEMILCIVHNQLNEEEAMSYANAVIIEFNEDSVIDAEFKEARKRKEITRA
jgi:hypothetical protein